MTSPEKEALRERREALGRFDQWSSAHPTNLSATVAVAAASRLYELLPSSSRQRPVDPQGVINLHRLLLLASRRR